MKTEEIQKFLSEIYKRHSDAYSIMHRKDNPNYGNGIMVLKEIEETGNLLLGRIPELESWVSEYESDRCHLWIRHLLERGYDDVKKFKEWSGYSTSPSEPSLNGMESWNKIEKVYKGPLDIRFSAALQAAYRAACAFHPVGFRHEGKCNEGLLCLGCDDDEWRWKEQCLETFGLPNNIFWNSKLHQQFLEEIRECVVEVPKEWMYKAETFEPCLTKIGGSTPFQWTTELIFRVHYYQLGLFNCSDPHTIHKTLRKYLPGLQERVKEDIRMCQVIREMY